MPAGLLLTHTAPTNKDEMIHDKTFTVEQIAEAFAAVRRDNDADYADSEYSSERGKFYIGDIETDVLAYLRGMACWMIHQDETARQAYQETSGAVIAEAEAADSTYADEVAAAVADLFTGDQRDEDTLFYTREVDAAVARWAR
jgi:hypothetical protein